MAGIVNLGHRTFQGSGVGVRLGSGNSLWEERGGGVRTKLEGDEVLPL